MPAEKRTCGQAARTVPARADSSASPALRMHKAPVSPASRARPTTESRSATNSSPARWQWESIIGSQVSALSFQLSAFSFQLSAFSIQLAAISSHLSAFSYQLSAISYQLSAISYQLSAISYQLSAISY